MKITLRLLCVALFLFGVTASSSATTIYYNVSFISGTTYQYDYTVVNDTLSVPLTDFIVYFPSQFSASNFDYSNITPFAAPAGWTGIGYEPSALDLGGAAEHFNFGSGIPAPPPVSSLAGFEVRFDYTGTIALGIQDFEVYDANFSLIDSGQTQPIPGQVPEPGSLLLLGTGALAILGLRLGRNR
jgi:hypothetical protein